MNTVLIMAGGQSSRMRAALGSSHKAQLPVLGVPMLERNLAWLLGRGYTDLHVAVSAAETALIEFVEQRCQPLAAAFGARLSLLVESSPLGTLGACRICPAEGDLLVVNVDNLTSLDVNAMLALHRRTDAAMTIATHTETFRMPFGQLVLDGDRVVKLVEKPETTYQISSGTYVLAPATCRAIADDRPCGPVELYAELTRAGRTTAAYRHEAPWIDVNDADSLVRAADLVARRHRDLDCAWPEPADQRIVLCLPDVPEPLVSRPTAFDSAHAGFIASFDEGHLHGAVTRCHLFDGAAFDAAERHTFRPLHEDDTLHATRIAARCLAYQRHGRSAGARP